MSQSQKSDLFKGKDAARALVSVLSHTEIEQTIPLREHLVFILYKVVEKLHFKFLEPPEVFRSIFTNSFSPSYAFGATPNCIFPPSNTAKN